MESDGTACFLVFDARNEDLYISDHTKRSSDRVLDVFATQCDALDMQSALLDLRNEEHSLSDVIHETYDALYSKSKHKPTHASRMKKARVVVS